MAPRWLGPGLFFATLATLLLETLNARLLSVLTWYHLSFFAVSLAMLGMAAGAVHVFLRPKRFAADKAPGALARTTFLFALSIPLSHLVTLVIPFTPITTVTTMEILPIAVFTVVLAVPFVLSGVMVTLALTRVGGPIGQIYAWDLIGAATGCLLVIVLLERLNLSSTFFIAGASAAVAAWCFHKGAGLAGSGKSLLVALVLAAAGVANTGAFEQLQIVYPKNRQLWLQSSLNAIARWNSHSYVIVHRPGDSPAFMWGPAEGADRFRTNTAWLVIDGEAGSPITQWNGRRESLEWVSYDVTTLPYFLRRQGDVAIVGVGGGRDILSALWADSRSVLGVEVNRIMIDLHSGSHRDFANIATQPQVTLVHDDGRAHLTRTDKRFDVLQISLVDTWASTGAGAFSLSENGLYTLEAWRVFLDRLKPGGVLSVSRWFDPNNVSETSRLVSLGIASLIDRGVARPADHLVLAVRERIATLMVSSSPFTDADRAMLVATAASRGYQLAVSPWAPAAGGPVIDRIAQSTTMAELMVATDDPMYDYRPPTDARPYYFNMLKPQALFSGVPLPSDGALGGNLRATLMLAVLLAVTTLLVALIIVYPLLSAGRPPMPGGQFALSMSYFAIIGFAFMLIQIAFLQRFAVYLGHPTYTLAVVLFSMLLFAGVGSVLSERLTVAAGGRFRFVPALIAAALVITALALPVVIAQTITATLSTRTVLVLAFTAPVATLLGFCFPLGSRLIAATPTVAAWAWGINGAFGVLASILAVGLSIWVGIDANFWLAACLYLSLTVPMGVMARHLVKG
jgi:SAM-dependent methyltransferase